MQNYRIRIRDKSQYGSSARLRKQDARIQELSWKVEYLAKESKIIKELLLGIMIPICLTILTPIRSEIGPNCNTTESFTNGLKSPTKEKEPLKFQSHRKQTVRQNPQRRTKRVYKVKPIKWKSR